MRIRNRVRRIPYRFRSIEFRERGSKLRTRTLTFPSAWTTTSPQVMGSFGGAIAGIGVVAGKRPGPAHEASSPFARCAWHACPSRLSLKQSNPSNDPTRSPSGKRDVVFTQPAAAAGHFPAKVASFVCKARRICFCARLSKHSLSLLSCPQGRRRLSQRRNLGVDHWKSM